MSTSLPSRPVATPPGPLGSRAGSGGVLPGREDPVVEAATGFIGGPPGRHLRVEARWWTALRVCLLFGGITTLLFGLVAKQHCRSSGWIPNNMYFHACYSDVPPLYTGRGLDQGLFPYLHSIAELKARGVDTQVEYPVLTGVLMWVEAKLVPGGAKDPYTTYFDINLLFAAAFLLGTIALTALTVRRRPWDAALVALCPAAGLAMTINWDMLAVVLLAGAMYAWAREKPELTGVLIGLGTAAKLYPVLIFLPLLLLGWRTRLLPPVFSALAYAVVAWVTVNIPFVIANFSGWNEFYSLSRSRPAGFSSIWYVADLNGLRFSPLNTWASGLTLVLFGAITALALRAPRRPRLASLTFLVVAAFLLANKVYSPQYLLWLVPLAALARPRWRDFWIWQAGELVHFVGIWLYLGKYANPNRGLGDTAYSWTVILHVAGTLWLSGIIVRDILRPHHDPVRADGVEDDPTGGVFDGALDARDVLTPGELQPVG